MNPAKNDARDNNASTQHWLSGTGTTHSSFTDIAPLADQLGQPIAPMPGERAGAITRTYVTAFLDLHLHGLSTRYPEVQFLTP